MFTISKFKFNSFHSYAMLILKLITMEALKKPLFYKLTKEYSTHMNIKVVLINGVKLKNSTHTKPSEKPINMFFLNILI